MFGSRTTPCGRSIWSRVAILIACFALIAAVLPATAGAAQPTARMHSGKTSITKVGTSRIAKVAKPIAPGSGASAGEFGPREENLDAKVSGSQSAARVPAAHVPAPAGQAVTTSNTGAAGFDALSHAEQRFSGTGAYAGTQFSTEPPDQGLCVGNGIVVEAVNTAVAVYSPAGATLAGPTPLNQLFGVAPEVIRSNPPVFGDFVGDPRCYYDPPTQRWFLTAFDVPVDSATGAFLDESHVKLAVSKTADPRGDWWIYDLDTTDGNGTVANHPNCPCFADQPLIGADAYAFFISTNEYSLEPFGAFFNGAQVYGFSKTQLETGSGGSLSGLHFDGIPLEEGMAYTIQPATTPAGGAYDLARGGTAYALSALDFTATMDNRIAVWALTGTSTIGTTNQVQPWVRILDSQSYGQPPDAEQRDGPTPLRDAEAAGLEGVKSVEHLELLAGNDDRMQQTVYSAGKLWSDLNTVVKTQNGNVQIGVAWFAVQPSWDGGRAWWLDRQPGVCLGQPGERHVRLDRGQRCG